MRNLVWFVAIGVSVCMSVRPASGQTDLKRLTLEELMDVDVTSVGRTRLPLERTAAAVTVITADEIRRSGITNIPELLRVIPGVQVARMNAGSWAISARGFNSTAANKLLVQIDGRPVYSPLFSGTFWEIQDLVLDEIARIEVVRGPGASLYGPNAVNGIINIITKSAHQTREPYLTLNGGGAEDLAVVSGRTGGGAGDTSYRVDGKYFYRDQLQLANSLNASDTTRTGRVGYRVDSAKGSSDFTLQGDFYNGSIGLANREDGKLLGGNILGRGIHRFAGGSELQVQTYFQRDYRRVPLQSEFSQQVFDIEFQHDFQLSRHGITWGGQYRWNHDDTKITPVLTFSPGSRTYPVVSGFVVDEIPLARERVLLTVGSKFEHNDFSGGEIQPSVRASWLFMTDHSVWTAISRAVRTPTRFDSDIQFGPPALTIFGNPDFQSEELVAYEMGYRGRPLPQLSLDAAVFYNVYDRLRSLEPLTPNRIIERNGLNAVTRGVEIESILDVTARVRLRGNYTFLGKGLSFDPGVVDFFGATLEGNDPRHQFLVQTAVDLPRNFEFDSSVRFVGQLPLPVVPRYTELDTRIGWNPTRGIETALIGRNLIHSHHPEFGAPGPNRIEAERNVYARITVRF